MDSDAEMLRVRQRVHDLYSITTAQRIAHDGLVERVDHLEPTVEALSRKDEIAAAVAARLKGERHLYLTVSQRLGGALIGAAAVADAILRATGH